MPIEKRTLDEHAAKIQKSLDEQRITIEKMCGLDSIGLVTSERDQFTPACNNHDREYDIMLQGIRTFETSETPDLAFWNDMQDIINISPWWKKIYLKPRQYLYYGIVKAYGKIGWRRR